MIAIRHVYIYKTIKVVYLVARTPNQARSKLYNKIENNNFSVLTFDVLFTFRRIYYYLSLSVLCHVDHFEVSLK